MPSRCGSCSGKQWNNRVMRSRLFNDLRFLWALPVIMVVYAATASTEFPEIAWASALAATTNMVAISVARYRPTSLVAIFSLMTMLSYSLAAFANLLLPEPAVTWDLWQEAEFAMWGSAVGS